MPETGGTTTQSGILYQNSVATLFLGRLCDAAKRLERDSVIRVRIEAPTEVDDIVVTFADQHTLYIQAKENIRASDSAWKKLWNDFIKQFRSPNFDRHSDRLALYTGSLHEEHNVLKELCERASGKDSYAEWQASLNQAQRDLVTRLLPLANDQSESNASLQIFTNDGEILSFFACIEVAVWSVNAIERDLSPLWMPPSNVHHWTLFRLLRDRVGGASRVRQAFTSEDLRTALQEDKVELQAPIDIDQLRTKVRGCGALLRQHKHTIANTGVHLRRAVINEILDWLYNPGEQRLAMLLDQAGMGKTVVMRDVLYKLEENGTTVLALKADQQLYGVSSSTDLLTKLQLPEPIERIIQRLAALSSVVVLIDQIDALSLSLARDQAALNMTLDLVARLRLIPGVRVLISCRTFDYRTDPQLKRIDARTPFQVTPLSDDEITRVLQPLGIANDQLPVATLQLMRTPLHLDLFTQVLTKFVEKQAVRNWAALTSIQDLYHLLWTEVILKNEPDAPTQADRIQALLLITEHMEGEQQTSVSQTILYNAENKHLLPAISWLASAGILLSTATEWTLLHQTFFDYCYARKFVEEGRSLAPAILQSEQGLRARPQMIQILAYLRGRDEKRYFQSLQQLFYTTDLRYHLSHLLSSWFGSLTVLSESELGFARRLLSDSIRRVSMLSAMSGNPSWFAHLSGTPLHSLLALNDEALDQQVLPYLASLLEVAQAEVVTLLQPFLGRGVHWNNRILWMLSRVRQWSAVEAVELLEQLFSLNPSAVGHFLYELHIIAQPFPLHGCRFVVLVLDQVLAEYPRKRQEAEERAENQSTFFPQISLQSEVEQLNNHSMVAAFKALSSHAPEYFVETMISWIERVFRLKSLEPIDETRFIRDELDTSWDYDGYEVSRALIQSIAEALAELARRLPGQYQAYAELLKALPYGTAQRIMCIIYRTAPDLLAEEALEFLLEDRRRFTLGDMRGYYHTRQVITAIYPYLTVKQRQRFEDAIALWTFDYPPSKLWHLSRRGIHQLSLLQAIPRELLTECGQRCLQELGRKLPDYQASDRTLRTMAEMVGPPINPNGARRMSDAAWLRAIQHYSGNTSHRDWRKGGARELSSVLQDVIKEQPARFYQLLERVPDDIDDVYVASFINGFAETTVPPEWFFAVVHRFGIQAKRQDIIPIYWALAKRADLPFPNDIVILLEERLKGGMDDREIKANEERKDSYNAYLNSVRCSAFQALLHQLRGQEENQDAINRRWEWIEFATVDSSSALRAGAIEELLYLMHLDRPRAVTLFQQLLQGHQHLICSHYADDFIYYALGTQWTRIEPYIRQMMEVEDDKCSQRGAELACIASLSHRTLKTQDNITAAQALAEQAIKGKATWRRGAARIYAHNIANGPAEQCAIALQTLLNDEDEQVLRHISGLFSQLRAEHLTEIRAFLFDFARSQAVLVISHFFTQYLWENSSVFPDIVLSLIEEVLGNNQTAEKKLGYRSDEELIRSVLRVYTDPAADGALQRRAMDVFDLLVKQFPGQSQSVLEEWDQR